MTIRKRNDERGFDRGRGAYSGNEKALKLDRRDHFLNADSNPFSLDEGDTKTKSAESTIMGNGDRKAGFAAKLDKK